MVESCNKHHQSERKQIQQYLEYVKVQCASSFQIYKRCPCQCDVLNLGHYIGHKS